MPVVKYKFGGVHNKLDPMEVVEYDGRFAPVVKSLVRGNNIDISDKLAARSRVGYSSVYRGGTHSLWTTRKFDEAFFVEDGVVYRLWPEGSNWVTSAVFEASNNDRMDFVEVNNLVVCSNGTDIRLIQQGVALDPPTTTPKVNRLPMFPGVFLAFLNGILYAANRDGVIYHSDPYDVDFMDAANCRIPLGGEASMLAAVPGGLWVSYNGRTVFLSGTDPLQFTFMPVAEYGVVHGAFTFVDSDKLGIDGFSGEAVVWASTQGVCIGGSTGKFKNLSEDFSFAPGEYGTVALRESEGLTHIITVLQGRSPEYNRDTTNIETTDYALF